MIVFLVRSSQLENSLPQCDSLVGQVRYLQLLKVEERCQRIRCLHHPTSSLPRWQATSLNCVWLPFLALLAAQLF
jgi:hypothetical protein